MMIIAVGAGEHIASVLPELGGLLAGPLVTLERVRVCKRDGQRLARPARTAGERRARPARLAEADGLHLRASALTTAPPAARRARPSPAREPGASGATCLRGIWGFHGDHAPHGDRLLQLRRHVPVVTIIVDTPSASPSRSRSWTSSPTRRAGHERDGARDDVARRGGARAWRVAARPASVLSRHAAVAPTWARELLIARIGVRLRLVESPPPDEALARRLDSQTAARRLMASFSLIDARKEPSRAVPTMPERGPSVRWRPRRHRPWTLPTRAPARRRVEHVASARGEHPASPGALSAVRREALQALLTDVSARCVPGCASSNGVPGRASSTRPASHPRSALGSLIANIEISDSLGWLRRVSSPSRLTEWPVGSSPWPPRSLSARTNRRRAPQRAHPMAQAGPRAWHVPTVPSRAQARPRDTWHFFDERSANEDPRWTRSARRAGSAPTMLSSFGGLEVDGLKSTIAISDVYEHTLRALLRRSRRPSTTATDSRPRDARPAPTATRAWRVTRAISSTNWQKTSSSANGSAPHRACALRTSNWPGTRRARARSARSCETPKPRRRAITAR